MPVIFISLILVVFYLIIQLGLTIAFFRYKNKLLAEPENWPEITVLVAARNEENNLDSCLNALCSLDYPKERLHIVVGNDQSTDRTAEIAQGYANKFGHVKVVDIKDDNSGLKAKARVMAQIDTYATGEFILVTDADVVVKPSWAKYLIRHMQENTGVASGTTMVKGNGLFSQMQGMDWAYFMGMLNVISYTGVPATAVGNNMIIRKQAYWETGGYAAIRFSITEDYRLYAEICKQGWKWDNIMIPEVMAYSGPIENFGTLLHQRKRWLTGGRELPWYWWVLFVVFGIYYFTIPLLFALAPAIALILASIKMLFQVLSINRIHNLVNEQRPTLYQHLLYELYLFFVTISTAIFFLLPVKTIWKGRKY